MRVCDQCLELQLSRRQTEEQSKLQEVEILKVRLDAAQAEAKQLIGENRKLGHMLEEVTEMIEKLQQESTTFEDKSIVELKAKVEKKRRKVKAMKEAVAIISSEDGKEAATGKIEEYLCKVRGPEKKDVEIDLLNQEITAKNKTISILESEIQLLQKKPVATPVDYSCLSCAVF